MYNDGPVLWSLYPPYLSASKLLSRGGGPGSILPAGYLRGPTGGAANFALSLFRLVRSGDATTLPRTESEVAQRLEPEVPRR